MVAPYKKNIYVPVAYSKTNFGCQSLHCNIFFALVSDQSNNLSQRHFTASRLMIPFSFFGKTQNGLIKVTLLHPFIVENRVPEELLEPAAHGMGGAAGVSE